MNHVILVLPQVLKIIVMIMKKSKYLSLNELEEYSKRKIYRQKSKSLSRTNFGVSLNTNKQIILFDINLKKNLFIF
jgi:hypothetical protein